jgi:hypothetical protein
MKMGGHVMKRIEGSAGRTMGAAVLILCIVFSLAAGFMPAGCLAAYSDDSDRHIENIAGLNAVDGEVGTNHFGFVGEANDGTLRITGLERVTFNGRAFTFYAQRGKSSSYAYPDTYQSEIKYFWHNEAPKKNSGQHPAQADRDLIVSYYGQGWGNPDDYGNYMYFKTRVFNNRLYIFYCTEKGRINTNGRRDDGKSIFYNSAGPPTEPGTPLYWDGLWSNVNYDSRVLTSQPHLQNPRRIVAAEVLNGKLFVFYAVCTNPGGSPLTYDWYYMQTEDGQTWSEPRIFKTGASSFPLSSAVYVTKRNNRTVEDIAFAYIQESTPGQGQVVMETAFEGQFTPGAGMLVANRAAYNGQYYHQSVTIAKGTVVGGYTDKQAIQVWATPPSSGVGWWDPHNVHPAKIYHAEFVPSETMGQYGQFLDRGDGGSWKEVFAGEDVVRPKPWFGYDFSSFWRPERFMAAWHAAPVFDVVRQGELRQYIDLVFLQDWRNDWYWGWRPLFKTFRYTSDVAKEIDSKTIDTWEPRSDGQDWRELWVLAGVVEGPPPVAPNGNPLSTVGEMYSKVSIGTSESQKFDETMTAGATVVAGLNAGHPLKHAASGSLQIGLELMNQHTSGTNVAEGINYTIDMTTEGNASSDRGWLLFFMPRIETHTYRLYASNGTTELNAPEYHVLNISRLVPRWKSYTLTNPGGQDNEWYARGMRKRPETTKYREWQSEVQAPSPVSSDYEIHYANKDLQGAVKTRAWASESAYRSSVTSSNLFASIDANLLFLSLSGKVNLGFALNHSEELSKSLEWYLAMPLIPDNFHGTYARDIIAKPYFLQAKTTGADWIPSYFKEKGARPWCITYRVLGAEERTKASTAKSATGSAGLTLYVPDKGGSILSQTLLPEGGSISDMRSFDVSLGQAVDLTAQPAPGYVFDRWVFDFEAIMTHGDAKALGTEVVMTAHGISGVGAVFKKILPGVDIRLNDRNPGKSTIKLEGAYLASSLLGIDPSREWLKVFVNGFSLVCTPGGKGWKKTENGYNYTSGKSILSLDLAEGRWSFTTSGRSISTNQFMVNTLKFGLVWKGKRYEEKVKADVKASFRGSPPPFGGQNAPEAHALAASNVARSLTDTFRIFEMRGAYNSKEPSKRTFSARGVIPDLGDMEPQKLIDHGIMAFFLGENRLFKARISRFKLTDGQLVYNHASWGTTSRMTIDLITGEWSLSLKGPRARVIPTGQDFGAMFIYDDSVKEGSKIGLGYFDYAVFWAGLDLLDITSTASVQVEGE